MKVPMQAYCKVYSRCRRWPELKYISDAVDGQGVNAHKLPTGKGLPPPLDQSRHNDG